MPARKAQRRPYKPLYIGQWLNRLGKRQNEAAEFLGVTETYISELVSGKKKNPNHEILYALSEWLGLTVNDFYRPPPPRAAVEAVDKTMSPADMAALGTLLDHVKKASR